VCRLPSAIAFAAWLVGGMGCATPVAKDRSLEEITQASTPYPTALSANATQKVVSAREQATPASTARSATAESPEVQPAPVSEQPLKTTPLQLPEEPAKSIQLSLKKDIPAPLPLAPHQRPLNFPLAVAPPQARPAEKQAEPAAPAMATSAAASPSPSAQPAPPAFPAVEAPPIAAAPTAPAGDAGAQTAAYAAELNHISSPAADALAMLNSPSTALRFPSPAETPAHHEAQLPIVPQVATAPVASAYSAVGYEPPPVVPESATSAVATTSAVEVESTPTPESTDQPTLAEQQAALIAALEAEIRQRRAAKSDQGEIARLELQLRLLYLLAERPDDAVAAIDALSLPERESCKHLLFGLAAFMEDEPASRAPHRNAKVLRALRDATKELAAGSRLDLRNMAFCEKVEYFGWYTEFPRYEFKPKQQVILYVEVENYAAESKGPQSFETELQGSYQIFDGSGQIIAERQLPLDREVCRNYRRDYFLAYRIYMPDSIPAGDYRLELTIEDLKARGQFQGRKLGQGTIDFSIR